MANNALSWIVKEAKRIKRLHPNKHRQWKGYVQEASAKYRSSHSGGSKKTVRPSRAPKRRKTKRVTVASHRSTAGGSITRASTVQLKGQLKSRIKDQIDSAVLKKFHAKKKRDKRHYQKVITAKRSELRKLC